LKCFLEAILTILLAYKALCKIFDWKTVHCRIG